MIPVYRSEETLDELYRRLVTVMERCSTSFEIIFVEDCGEDGSWHTIRRLAGTDSRVRGIRLTRNFGQHNALLCGIRAAQFAVIITLDDDLQNPPEEIPKLLRRLAEGFDVVYGAPARERHGFIRNQVSRLTKIALRNAMNVDTARHVSAFRAFRARIRDGFADFRSPFVSIDVLLTWGSTRFSHVVVRHDSRAVGTSNYSARKLLTHALNMMTGFTTIPLQLASVAGFTFSLFGFGVLAYVVLRYLFQGSTVPGFAFLASIIAIFCGVQLAALGIIGEYLARIHLRTMERPPYLVREEAHQPLPADQPLTATAAHVAGGQPERARAR